MASFTDIVSGPFATYMQTSRQIGGDVATHSSLVEAAFQAQKCFLATVSHSKEPTESQLIGLLRPISESIQSVQEFRERHRPSPLFNHLSAVSESISALGWVTVAPTPAPYIKEMNDAGQFYTNRVLKEWKEKDKVHVDWVRAWIQTLVDLQTFVKDKHTTGLLWNPKGGQASVPSKPAGPGGPPPPPPIANLDLTVMDDAGQGDHAALFAEINKGNDVTKGLKKVTSDMQTHKNPALRSVEPVSRSAGEVSKGGRSISGTPADKPPRMVLDGKKWIVEYQKGVSDLVIDQVKMNHVVYVYRCENSTIQVKGKVNSIFLDLCKKTSVVFDDLVSSIEFVNCQSVQMQVMNKVPTISIDKTDGCQMYLSKDSLHVEIISSKSSEMNVLVPKGDGDYTEYPIPEQFKTTVTNKGLKTIISENLG